MAITYNNLYMDIRQELRQAGATVEKHPWLPGCFEVSATGDLESLQNEVESYV